MARKKRSASSVRKMHRSFGVIASLFIIFMVITGLIINHSNSLGLDKQHTSNTLVLDWYGLDKPKDIQSFRVGSDWITAAGSQLFHNEKPISGFPGLLGAVSSNGLLIVASRDELLLLDTSGQIVERQAWKPFSDSPIESIGLHSGGKTVLISGSQLWSPDTDLIKWQVIAKPAGSVNWSNASSAPAELVESITDQYRGKGLSLERVLLDLHSGRFFGTLGVIIYDLLALILGFLAISGLILWFRSKGNGKQVSSHSNRNSEDKTTPTRDD